MNYEIVFPYQKTDGQYINTKPEFNLLNGNCSNSTITSNIFNSKEEAEKYRDELNDSLLTTKLSQVTYRKNFQEILNEIQEEFYDKLSIYKELELIIEEKTQKLKLGIQKPQNEIIIHFKEKSKQKAIKYSIYEFIHLYWKDNFIVYNVSEEDYEKIKENLSQSDTLTINKEVILKSNPNKNIVNIMSPNSLKENNLFLSEDGINSQERPELQSLNSNNPEIIVYTTESLENIIKTYQHFYEKEDAITLTYHKKV